MLGLKLNHVSKRGPCKHSDDHDDILLMIQSLGHWNKEPTVEPLTVYVDELVQERRTSSALALELRPSCTCTNSSMWW